MTPLVTCFHWHWLVGPILQANFFIISLPNARDLHVKLFFQDPRPLGGCTPSSVATPSALRRFAPSILAQGFWNLCRPNAFFEPQYFSQVYAYGIANWRPVSMQSTEDDYFLWNFCYLSVVGLLDVAFVYNKMMRSLTENVYNFICFPVLPGSVRTNLRWGGTSYYMVCGTRRGYATSIHGNVFVTRGRSEGSRSYRRKSKAWRIWCRRNNGAGA